MVLTLGSADEIEKHAPSYFSGAVYYAVHGGWITKVWPFKWHLLSLAVQGCVKYCKIFMLLSSTFLSRIYAYLMPILQSPKVETWEKLLQLTVLDMAWFFFRTLCSSCRALTHLTRSFSLSVNISCVRDSPGGVIWDAVICNERSGYHTLHEKKPYGHHTQMAVFAQFWFDLSIVIQSSVSLLLVKLPVSSSVCCVTVLLMPVIILTGKSRHTM